MTAAKRRVMLVTLPCSRCTEVLGVSRPAVREALHRLTAAGLIEIRQGDTTTCVTTVSKRAWTCCPTCFSGPANSMSPWCAAFSRPDCTTDPKSPNWRRAARELLEPATAALMAALDALEVRR